MSAVKDTFHIWPEDLSRQIFSWLSAPDLLVTQLVSQTWKTFASMNAFSQPIADALCIAYGKDDIIWARIIKSCKQYSDAAEPITNFKDKNILVQALGRRLLIRTATFTIPPESNAVLQAFAPLFDERKEAWLAKNPLTIKLKSLNDHDEQQTLKKELFTLCQQFKEHMPSNKEIVDLFDLFKLRGFREVLSIQCFKDFQTTICQNHYVLSLLVESVVEQDPLEPKNIWADYLIELTLKLIVTTYDRWASGNQFYFPTYWCELLRKVNQENYDAFLKTTSAFFVEEAWVEWGRLQNLNDKQMEMAGSFFYYYILCIREHEREMEIHLRALIPEAVWRDQAWCVDFAKVIELDGIYVEYTMNDEELEEVENYIHSNNV